METAQIHGNASEEPMSNARAFALHLWAFLLPLITLSYWLTAPHTSWASLLWTMPIWILVYVDNHAKIDTRQPREDIPSWPFNLQVYALFAIQIANYVLLGVVASHYSIHSIHDAIETAAAMVPVLTVSGVTAGYSGIVLGHELVHRRHPIEYLMGRVLLMGVLYEHFATEHVRGHHPRVGTADDPATARFGETRDDFIRRAIPAQFKSAWHLENVRIGAANMKWYDPRLLKHRVLQGVLAELGILTSYYVFFGWIALVGLSRHADHHAQAARPYQKLRYFPETPKMPHGYYGTILLAMGRNDKYIKVATRELKRRGLGPFRNEEEKPQPRSHLHPSLRGARDAREAAERRNADEREDQPAATALRA